MDINRVDLNLLVVLDALLDECHVTRAAKRLGLSQPAVSAALGRLRSVVGDPLFTRASRGLIPTPRAQELRAPVKTALQAARAILRPDRFDPEAATGRFAMAATDLIQQSIAVPLFEALRQQAPGIALHVQSLEIADLSRRLENGELDLAVSIPEFATEALMSRSLFDDRYVGVARRGHPFLKGRRTIERFCRYDHAFVNPRGGTPRGPVDDALEAIGHGRRIGLCVASFLVLPAMLARSDLLVVIPERLARTLPGDLQRFEAPVDLPTIRNILVWHPRSQNDPRHRWLRERVVACARG